MNEVLYLAAANEETSLLYSLADGAVAINCRPTLADCGSPSLPEQSMYPKRDVVQETTPLLENSKACAND
jgi:hypothetical protein